MQLCDGLQQSPWSTCHTDLAESPFWLVFECAMPRSIMQPLPVCISSSVHGSVCCLHDPSLCCAVYLVCTTVSCIAADPVTARPLIYTVHALLSYCSCQHVCCAVAVASPCSSCLAVRVVWGAGIGLLGVVVWCTARPCTVQLPLCLQRSPWSPAIRTWQSHLVAW